MGSGMGGKWGVFSSKHGEAFLEVSKHIPEGCNPISEGCTVKYQEYRGKDPAVQVEILLVTLA